MVFSEILKVWHINIFSLMYQKLYFLSLVNKSVNEITVLKFIGVFLCFASGAFIVNSNKSCISNTLSIGPSSLKLILVYVCLFLVYERVAMTTVVLSCWTIENSGCSRWRALINNESWMTSGAGSGRRDAARPHSVNWNDNRNRKRNRANNMRDVVLSIHLYRTVPVLVHLRARLCDSKRVHFIRVL